jgi:hypothetical protein
MPVHRARHVKCGEEKPTCQRCRDVGRPCGGYKAALSPSEGHGSSPTPSLSPAALPGLMSPVQNAVERRYFNYFRQHTIPDLAGYDSQSYFWNYIVLQTCHASPAVLHAALALGALYEHTHNGSAASDDKIGRLILQQSNKAIRNLCIQGPKPPVQVALVCCVVFICLGNAQGDHEGALRHLQNGLSMLEEWRLQEGGTKSTRVQETFAQVFCRLDIQATSFLDSRQPRLYSNSFNGVSAYGSIIPKSFASLSDAQVVLESIAIRSFYSLTSKTQVHYASQKYDDCISAREVILQGLAARLNQWHGTFEAFLAAHRATMQRNDLQFSVLLKLHHRTMSLMLRLKSDPDFAASAALDSPKEVEFSSIISAARSLISSSTTPSRLKFTAEMGIIAPLYFTAMKSISAQIQRDAVELISKCNRREGFWDPEMVAKIAGRVLESRDGVGPGGIPDLAKLYLT